jgi:hypothetical protein
MKIVQTFWSTPCLHNSISDPYGRNLGGWTSEKIHAMSWALSCLKFKQFYPELELHTDTEGENWLINKLNLPYSSVVKSLDNFNWPEKLWALAKLNTCGLQSEAFLHADGDIFIWKAFDSQFINSAVFAQNVEFEKKESKVSIYSAIADKFLKQTKNIPRFVGSAVNLFKITGKFEAYNTGIFGGYNIDFIKKYSDCVFSFLNKNKDLDFESKDMNFIEQFFLYGFAKENKCPVRVLFNEENCNSETGYSAMQQFHLAPLFRKYIHLVGAAKRNPDLSGHIPNRLRYEFPKIYNHIQRIYRNKNVSFHTIQNPHLTKDKFDLTCYFSNTLKILKKAGIKTKKTFICLGNTVEHLYYENINNINYQWLFNIYSIEKSTYLYNKQKKNKSECHQDWKNLNLIFNLLYDSSLEKFLEQKFRLNKNITILLLHFFFPEKFSIDYLNGYISNNERVILKETEIGILKSIDNTNLQISKLSNIQAALIYFEGSQLNARELIALLNKIGFKKRQNEESLEIIVVSLITFYSLYYNYLIPLK